MKIDPAKRQISGWVNNQRFVNHPETFRNYFVIQFDRPFEEYGLWENEHDERFPGMTEGEGKGYGAYVRFKAGTKVQARAASSYISPEQALLTLDRELGADKNLEATRKRGAETWNALLGRIAVEGGTDEEIRTFYSCLFRANLFSRKFYERDAEGNPYYYSPYDGKVHAGYMYTDNGFMGYVPFAVPADQHPAPDDAGTLHERPAGGTGAVRLAAIVVGRPARRAA